MTTSTLLDVDEPREELVRPRRWWRSGEFLWALVGFVVFAVIVLSKAAALLEPDDYAYRASIVALSHGHILLTNAQYINLNKQLASTGGQGIVQWHHLASGKWISEKNPGYPFFAVIFYLLDLLRVTPLFYGALACVGLFVGARAWLGKWAGTYAVWLYCFSGAAITFAWRATMPSFTDASLIAAGFGTLLWVMLSDAIRQRRRGLVGLLGFVALEGAVFIRYTNVIELGVALLAVLVLARRCHITWRSVALWMGSVVAFGILVLGFDKWAYGSTTSTGYSAGEITFSIKALWPNLKGMPKYLTSSMPFWILAFVAIVWIGVRAWRVRRGGLDETARASVQRDALVGAVLALGWLGLWFLYLNYTWTANMVNGAGGIGGGHGGGTTVHVIRFYLPALGLVALLATWLVVRLQRVISWTLVAALAIAAFFSFHSMASSGSIGANGAGPFGGRGFGNGPQGSPSSIHYGTPPGGAHRHGAPPGGGNGGPPNGEPGANG
jgi:hypothetical protein